MWDPARREGGAARGWAAPGTLLAAPWLPCGPPLVLRKISERWFLIYFFGIFPAYQNIQKPGQKKTALVALLKTASVRVSFVQIMQEWRKNSSKSVWKIRYVWDVSTPPSLAIACPQAIQSNELDATKKTLTNSFASLDVYKHVLRRV